MTPKSRPALWLQCSSPLRVKWAASASFIDVRCKRCQGCLRVRQYSWIVRAAHEQAFAKRTWFITLTFAARQRVIAMAHASAMAGNKSTSARLVAATGAPVSRYLKRLRKAGFAFRYVLVPELHRNGFPHWHGLVHDLRGDLKWKPLHDTWASHVGFAVVKLVKDENAIRYVTKYLSKDTQGRIRASLKYGETEADRQQVLANRSAATAPPGDGSDGKT